MYSIHQMSHSQITVMRVGVEETLHEAVRFASRYHGLNKPDVTLTVEIEGAGVPLYSFSTRRIMGDFTKQQWGGPKGNDAIACGEDRFDATLHILSMPYQKVIAIKDDHDSSDLIGQAHVDWHGPHCVTLVDSMCDFFGVSKLAEITEEHFAFVVLSRQQEIAEHWRAEQMRQRTPKRIQTPDEAARDLLSTLANLSTADPQSAQTQLNDAIARSRQIVNNAVAHGWDVAVVDARTPDDAADEMPAPGAPY
jgi:hypothetical protein